MIAVPFEETPLRQVHSGEYRAQLRCYIGRVAEIHEGPTVFYAEIPDAGSTVRSHFHDVDQFQIIVGGHGRFGAREVAPLDFHYADAYSPYGPIVVPEGGLAYLTVRAGCATGYFPMPQSRQQQLARGGRNLVGRFEVEGTGRRTLLPTQEDGLQVVGLRAAPGESVHEMDADAGDQFLLVFDGSIEVGGCELGRLGVAWNAAGEPGLRFQAGPEGAAVLLMQFPRPGERPGSDPRSAAAAAGAVYRLPEGAALD